MAPVDEEMAFEQRYVSVQPNLDESAWTLSGRLPGFAGRTVVAALEAKADTFPYGPGANPSRTTRNADALWAISHDSIRGDDGATGDSSTPVVSVFVDATEAAPTNGDDRRPVEAGPQVGPNTLAAILCDGVVEVTARTPDGMPLALGRRTRAIPPRLRRFILHRDGGVCTISGCVSDIGCRCITSRHGLEGGRTDPGNLSTVCWFHHHVVIHGQGFTIDPTSPPQRRRLPDPGSTPPRAPLASRVDRLRLSHAVGEEAPAARPEPAEGLHLETTKSLKHTPERQTSSPRSNPPGRPLCDRAAPRSRPAPNGGRDEQRSAAPVLARSSKLEARRS